MGKLLHVGDVHARDSSPQYVPNLLDWVEVGAECWPWQDVEMLPIQEVSADLSCVGSGVVLHKFRELTMSPEKRHNDRLEDFIDVPMGIQVPVNDDELCPMLVSHSSPHHDRARTKAVYLGDTAVTVTASVSSPDSCTTIGKRHLEPTFIREKNTPPSWSKPANPSVGPLQPGDAMVLLEWDPDMRTTALQSRTLQPSPHRLC